MIVAEITLGGRQFLIPALLLAGMALGVLFWSYARSPRRNGTQLVALLLKMSGIIALTLCLLEPLYTGTRPRPGSNLVLVVADDSRSLQVVDPASGQPRAESMSEPLQDEAPWLVRLGQDFDLRRYTIDETLHPVKTFHELRQQGQASQLVEGLRGLADRFRDRPVAGIVLLTDGNATDADQWGTSHEGLPPVFPVPVGSDSRLLDVSVDRVEVTQTNFEAAPVTLTARIVGQSLGGREVLVRVLDEKGSEVERRGVGTVPDAEPHSERFLLRPEKTGISFYTVEALLKDEETLVAKGEKGSEATLDNNRRMVTVDRGGGPYRVLYVGGRPSWEFKFLRRAIDADDELNLVGLLRIARKEPKFAFMGRGGERTNPLFRGFTNQEEEQAEQYDQPVLIRLGTADATELRQGFPSTAEDLFPYHAVIIDDIEQGFFKQDQLSLLQQFVSRRGGGLLMLGGVESFVEGGYLRGPVAEMLPVYVEKARNESPPGGHRLRLTREGWLQPWVRLRTNESDEEARLAGMPDFNTLNEVRAIKPGAAVLAQVTGSDESLRPALVVQPYGRGRTGALLVGDLWRWHLRRSDPASSDLERSWRQMIRWLVSDVPSRIDISTLRGETGGPFAREIRVGIRDREFEPLDNAQVSLQVTGPDQKPVELNPDPSLRIPGQHLATYVPRSPGAYRVRATVTDPDGSAVGERDAGWVMEPQTEEFRSLAVNRTFLTRIAADTGGEVISMNGLDDFVAGLPNRKIPVVETWTYPIWNRWPVFLLAVSCLAGEWALRRLKGLP